MRYPDVAGVLEVAATVTGTPAPMLARQARVDLLATALNRPSSHRRGVELYPTIEGKVAVTVEQLVRHRPFARHNREIAVAFALVTFDAFGYDWPGLRDGSDVPLLKPLLVGVEGKDIDASELEHWFRSHVVKPPTSVTPLPLAPPCLFIGYARSRATPTQRAAIDSMVDKLAERLPSIAAYLGLSWVPELHRPDDFDPDSVYDEDSQKMFEDVDGFVYLEHEPSSGGGLNFAWAASLALPILHLHPLGERSRILSELPANVVQDSYTDGAGVVVSVFGWLERMHRVIADQGRRRRNLDVLWLPLWCALRNQWDLLQQDDKYDVAAISGLDLRRVLQLLANPRTVRAGSGTELVALCSALGLDTGRWLTGRAKPAVAGGRPGISATSERARRVAFAQLGLAPSEQAAFAAWYDNRLAAVGNRVPATSDDWIVAIRRWQGPRR